MIKLSLVDFAARLGELTVEVEREKRRALEEAARVVQAKAKDLIGHDENPAAGPFMEGMPLAEATQEEKERLGFVGNVSEYDSELRKGEMRDSIEYAVSEDLSVVGSDSDVAVAQELGVPEHNLPPRSFLGAAGYLEGETVAKILGAGIVKALVGEEVLGGALPIP